MPKYFVHVESQDYIEVRAENETEAMHTAIDIMNTNYSNNWEARVMGVEPDEGE